MERRELSVSSGCQKPEKRTEHAEILIEVSRDNTESEASILFNNCYHGELIHAFSRLTNRLNYSKCLELNLKLCPGTCEEDVDGWM